MLKDFTRKEIIFYEAVRLFAEKGYKDVTLREVAKAAGISEPAIYRHYDRKADILDEIIDEFERKLKGYILTKEKIDRYIETDTPRQLLERCIGRFTEEDTNEKRCRLSSKTDHFFHLNLTTLSFVSIMYP